MDIKSRIKICVCIATCKRKTYLAILLKKLSQIRIPNNVILKVIVVDNDPEESAALLVLTQAKEYPYGLVYDTEKERGIPFTRNKAVSLADKDSDFIAFIDDDEYPEKNWIYKLLEIQQETNADLVQGPAWPEFVDNPPAWVIKGKFFIPSYFYHETGSQHSYSGVATNNLLVRYNLLMQIKGPFDETMGLIGCDDNALGINLNKIGCKMIFTSHAIVHEFITKSRTNIQWILQRAYRTANTHWLLTQHKSFYNLLRLLLGALGRIVICSILFIPALIIAPFIGLHYCIKLLRLIVRGIAIIAGIFGKYYEEYRHAFTTATF